MKKIIIYASIHHKNTKKVAEAIHSEFGGRLIPFSEARKEDLAEADIIGIGSGIYLRNFHKGLINLVKSFSDMEGKKVFLFSTAGTKNRLLNKGHRFMKNILLDRGGRIIGEFDCLGYDTYGPLKLIGGVNKNRPDEDDLRQAQKFGKKMAEK